MNDMRADTAMAEYQHITPAGNIALHSNFFNMLGIDMCYRQIPHTVCPIQPSQATVKSLHYMTTLKVHHSRNLECIGL